MRYLYFFRDNYRSCILLDFIQGKIILLFFARNIIVYCYLLPILRCNIFTYTQTHTHTHYYYQINIYFTLFYHTIKLRFILPYFLIHMARSTNGNEVNSNWTTNIVDANKMLRVLVGWPMHKSNNSKPYKRCNNSLGSCCSFKVSESWRDSDFRCLYPSIFSETVEHWRQSSALRKWKTYWESLGSACWQGRCC